MRLTPGTCAVGNRRRRSWSIAGRRGIADAPCAEPTIAARECASRGVPRPCASAASRRRRGMERIDERGTNGPNECERHRAVRLSSQEDDELLLDLDRHERQRHGVHLQPRRQRRDERSRRQQLPLIGDRDVGTCWARVSSIATRPARFANAPHAPAARASGRREKRRLAPVRSAVARARAAPAASSSSPARRR